MAKCERPGDPVDLDDGCERHWNRHRDPGCKAPRELELRLGLERRAGAAADWRGMGLDEFAPCDDGETGDALQHRVARGRCSWGNMVLVPECGDFGGWIADRLRGPSRR